MELNIQTPALLFPAVSLLMLAYTNKFLAIANLIRRLFSDYQQHQEHTQLLRQIVNLRRRLQLIRLMQVFAVASVLFCVLTMYFIYENFQATAKALFALSLLLMIASLLFSLIELFFSTGALRLLLRDLEKQEIIDRLDEKDVD